MRRLRIVVTQRVEQVQAYSEMRDCLDQEWTKLLDILGFDIIPVPNNLSDPAGWLTELAASGVILTGGNDLASVSGASNPSELRDTTEEKVLGWARSHSIPVLGVCRGMQMINVWLGGELVSVEGHVARNHPITLCDASRQLIADKTVNSFHNLGIFGEQLAKELEVLAISPDGVIEACRHKTLPWLGMMWHPERKHPYSESDKKLIFEHFNQGKK